MRSGIPRGGTDGAVEDRVGCGAGGSREVGVRWDLGPSARSLTGAALLVRGVFGAAVPAPPKAVSFRLDVMPVFFRAGCNSGGCHGAAAGKDGFHLSLFGYDPAGDYYRLTRQIVGRRVDLAEPAQS